MTAHIILILSSFVFCIAPISILDADSDGVPEVIAQDKTRRHEYPLKQCVVCDETLGKQMFPHDVQYARTGSSLSQQLVRFCSPTCQRIFERTPKKSWKNFNRKLAEVISASSKKQT